MYAQVCRPVSGEARVQARLAEHIQPTQAGLGAASPADTELVTVRVTKLVLQVRLFVLKSYTLKRLPVWVGGVWGNVKVLVEVAAVVRCEHVLSLLGHSFPGAGITYHYLAAVSLLNERKRVSGCGQLADIYRAVQKIFCYLL